MSAESKKNIFSLFSKQDQVHVQGNEGQRVEEYPAVNAAKRHQWGLEDTTPHNEAFIVCFLNLIFFST